MPYIVALVGVLSLLNLMLTLAMARWVRRHGELHASPGGGSAPPPRLPAGTQIPEFTTVTVTGANCSLSDLTGARSAVGFFSVGCPPCHEQVAHFKSLARQMPGGAGQALAIVLSRPGDPGGAAEFARELAGAASVAVEERGGAAQRAFSVKGWPSFYLLDERGRVEASGPIATRLAAGQPV